LRVARHHTLVSKHEKAHRTVHASWLCRGSQKRVWLDTKKLQAAGFSNFAHPLHTARHIRHLCCLNSQRYTNQCLKGYYGHLSAIEQRTEILTVTSAPALMCSWHRDLYILCAARHFPEHMLVQSGCILLSPVLCVSRCLSKICTACIGLDS